MNIDYLIQADPLYSLQKINDEFIKDKSVLDSPYVPALSKDVTKTVIGIEWLNASPYPTDNSFDGLDVKSWSISEKISGLDVAFKDELGGTSEQYSDRDCSFARPSQSTDRMISVANGYAQVCSSNHSMCRQRLRMTEDQFGAGGRVVSAQDKHSLVLEAEESRAERDVWSLLALLTRANLMRELDHQKCEARLEEELDKLPPHASRRQVLLAALRADDRLRKSKEVKDWLEQTAEDLVEVLPPMSSAGAGGGPWAQTLGRLLDGPSLSGGVASVHPDGQLGPGGLFLPLDAADAVQQEALLKAVWQYVRCGQLVPAQELAAQQGCFWLAAALLGVSEDYAVDSGSQSEGSTVDGLLVDNPNYTLWLQSCWFHAEALGGCSANMNLTAGAGRWEDSVSTSRFGHSSASYSAVLEASIYAALSGHWEQLHRSPLVHGGSWGDKLWAAAKTAYDLDTARLMLAFQQKKIGHSALYPECSENAIAGEEDAVRRLGCASFLRRDRGGDGAGTGLELALRVVPAPQSSALPSAEECLLSLQAALIAGPDDLEAWLASKQTAAGWWDPRRSSVHAKTRLLRLRAHLALWLHLSSDCQSHLRALAPYSMLQQALRDYALHLSSAGGSGHAMAATYVTFMDRPDRVSCLIEVLRTFDQPTTDVWDLSYEDDTDKRTVVLETAIRLLPGADVLQTLRLLVEQSRLSLSHSVTSLRLHRQVSVSAAQTADTELCKEFRTAVSTLQWLCLHSAHREEAVRQALYFGRDSVRRGVAGGSSALTTRAVADLSNELDYIFTRTLPADSAQVATDELLLALQQRPTEDADRRCKGWASEVRELLFWRGVTEALRAVRQWHKSANLLLMEQTAVLGDSRTASLCLRSPWQRLEDAALRAADSLLRALRCDYEPASEAYSLGLMQSAAPDGVTDLFHEAEATLLDAAVAEVFRTAGLARDVHSFVQERQAEYEDRQVETLLGRLADGRNSSMVKTPTRYPLELLDSLSMSGRLPVTVESVTASVQQGRLVHSQTATLLLHQYLHICETTASNAATIGGADCGASVRWLQKVVTLADFVADDHPALQLKTVVPRADLVAMLDKMKDAAVGVMRLTSSNDLSLPSLLC